MYSINSIPHRIFIGRQGETGTRRIQFDAGAWTELDDELNISIIAIRPGETEAYVPQGVTLSGEILTWVPDTTDTDIAGTGAMLIRGTDGDGNVIKSAQTTYVVESAFDDEGYEPTPAEESWLTRAEQTLADLVAELNAANEQDIEAAAEAWLEENITQETGYVIDASLTVSGAAADAKAVGDKIGAVEESVHAIGFAGTDLSQWLYAKDKYINSNFELADLNGYDTYRIPCRQLDFVSLTWTGSDPFYGLSASYRYTFEDENGFRRDLTNINIVIDSTLKKCMFIAPADSVAVYFTFKSDLAANATLYKNTPREYSSGIDYFANFAVPVTPDTFVVAKWYMNSATGAISSSETETYRMYWKRFSAGDRIVFKSLVPGQTLLRCMDSSGVITDVNSLSHTFDADALAHITEDVTKPGNALYIPNGLKLKVDGENVIGLESEIGKIIGPVTEAVDELDERVVTVEAKFSGEDMELTTGEESGYWRITDGEIEAKTSSSFSRTRIAVQGWMEKVSYTIVSLSGISDSAVFCAFADENEDFISKPNNAVGTTTAQIPSNAAYIYLCFYGSTYCSGYTISGDRIVMASELEGLGIENHFDGLTGVAFGTSLTYRAQTTGGYLQYLPEMSGITFDNQGVGSSYILGDGGDRDMLAKIKAYQGYSGKRICLLEGFVNDWYNGKTLGTYTDTAETTVCGCVRSALNHMLSQNANLTIFLILDPYGRNYGNVDCSSSSVRYGKTQYEYYSEISKVAESLGIPVIKEYSESQMSENTPQYYIDNIHPNALGARQTANLIWSRMRWSIPNAVS